MSQETQEWLEQNIKVGFTTERGKAWWAREDDDTSQFPGAIPTEEARRLIGFEVVESPLAAILPSGEFLTVPDKKALIRADTATVLGTPGTGYLVHDNCAWLLENVFAFLGGGVEIGSVGLLRGGAVAFAQMEFKETMQHAGERFRPFITAVTSLDSSFATTYKSGAQRVVCDNTLAAFLGADNVTLRKRHTSGSKVNAEELRQRFNVQLGEIGDAFTAELDQLLDVSVSDAQWAEFLNAHTGDPSEMDKGRTKSLAEKKQDTLNELYFHDPRVAPWSGSEWGVLQAVSTFQQHLATIQGGNRVETNALKFLGGKTAVEEAEARATLDRILTTT